MSRRRLAARCVLALCVVALGALVVQGLRRAAPPPAPGPPTAPGAAALVAALGPENPSQVRVWALELMAQLGGARSEVLPHLRAALEDPDPAVRDAARRSLAPRE